MSIQLGVDDWERTERSREWGKLYRFLYESQLHRCVVFRPANKRRLSKMYGVRAKWDEDENEKQLQHSAEVSRTNNKQQTNNEWQGISQSLWLSVAFVPKLCTIHSVCIYMENSLKHYWNASGAQHTKTKKFIENWSQQLVQMFDLRQVAAEKWNKRHVHVKVFHLCLQEVRWLDFFLHRSRTPYAIRLLYSFLTFSLRICLNWVCST